MGEPVRDPSVRLMRPDDLDAVTHLHVLAFTQYLRQTGRGEVSPPRKRQNLLACLNLNPAGCFVAVTDRPVGFIFSRVWGQVGWFGTFGVDPDAQGQGIGQRLITAAVEHLKQAGCSVIGLETMPDSPYNVGLYARFSFYPYYSTLTVIGQVGAPEQLPSYALFGQLPDAAIDHVTQISRAAWSELDYAIEARSARQFGWGETLLVGWPEPWAAATVRTVARSEGQDAPVCEVVSLAVPPQERHRIAAVFQVLEAFAHDVGAPQVSLPINTFDGQTLQAALRAGYRVNHVALRMILNGETIPPAGIDLSRWAM